MLRNIWLFSKPLKNLPTNFHHMISSLTKFYSFPSPHKKLEIIVPITFPNNTFIHENLFNNFVRLFGEESSKALYTNNKCVLLLCQNEINRIRQVTRRKKNFSFHKRKTTVMEKSIYCHYTSTQFSKKPNSINWNVFLM